MVITVLGSVIWSELLKSCDLVVIVKDSQSCSLALFWGHYI
jgi:hypothetical protein